MLKIFYKQNNINFKNIFLRRNNYKEKKFKDNNNTIDYLVLYCSINLKTNTLFKINYKTLNIKKL